MKKVILFSRNDLVNLFGGMSQYLSTSADITHLAYSVKEESILREKYHINNIINFRDEIRSLMDQEKPDFKLIGQIDQLIIEHTDNRFCLNSCIQSDRTLVNVPYDDILLLIQVYYKFWNKYFGENGIELLLHEPVALLFLQIASVVSKKAGASYLTTIQVFGEKKYNWIFVSAENGSAVELPEKLSQVFPLNSIDKQRVSNFLKQFRKDFGMIIPQLATKIKKPGDQGILKFLHRLFITFLKHFYHKLKNRKLKYIKAEPLEKYLNSNRQKLSDRLKNSWDEYFHLKYDDFDSEKDFYYYPMHMEPEAVVLYWGDGIYKNQIKLIENISGQLPPNCFLYVKVHPIVKEERHFLDYKRVKDIPNVKLLGPDVPGKLIIAKCKGLITINGTSGFEAILMNKPVYVFGNSFYDLSNRVYKIKNIRDLREILYLNHHKTYQDDDELYHFIYAFLEITHPGFTSYYNNYKELLKIEHLKNVEQVAIGINQFISKVNNRKK